MPQLNVYVPGELEREIRQQAKREGKTLSSFIAGLFRSKKKDAKWDSQFIKEVLGGWQGKAPEITRPLPEERDIW